MMETFRMLVIRELFTTIIVYLNSYMLFLFYLLNDKEACDHGYIEHHMTLCHRPNM